MKIPEQIECEYFMFKIKGYKLQSSLYSKYFMLKNLISVSENGLKFSAVAFGTHKSCSTRYVGEVFENGEDLSDDIFCAAMTFPTCFSKYLNNGVRKFSWYTYSTKLTVLRRHVKILEFLCYMLTQ